MINEFVKMWQIFSGLVMRRDNLLLLVGALVVVGAALITIVIGGIFFEKDLVAKVGLATRRIKLLLTLHLFK